MLLLNHKRAHIAFDSREGLLYRKRKGEEILDPEKFISVFKVGADQSAFGLPHFVVKAKSQRGHYIKVQIIGALVHRRPHKFRLRTVTMEHTTVANHTIEYVYLLINDYPHPLPPFLFIELDSCGREKIYFPTFFSP